jgi:predicted enzyme related to lactoylglutathione lyase
VKKKTQAKSTTTKSPAAKKAAKKAVAKQAVTKPKAASPKAAASKVANPKVAAPKAASPKAAAPKAAPGKRKVRRVVERVRPLLDRVAFTMLQVEDAARARAFYEDKLGLVRGLASPDGTWTEYDLPGGGCLALFRHPAGSFEASGGAAVAFEVPDLDGLNQRLQADGVRYLGDIVKGPNCRMSNILDSEGNGLILHQLDRH